MPECIVAMKSLCPPSFPWIPHTITFHGDSRLDPFYWLRGQLKAKEDSNADDLTLLHYSREEYGVRGISRNTESCPVSSQDIKNLLKMENAYTDTFIPWKLRMSDEFTDAVTNAVLNLPPGTESPKVTVRSALAHDLPSPLLSLSGSFPTDAQMISGISSPQAGKRKSRPRKDEYSTSRLETPVHYLYRELKRRVHANDSSIPHRDSRYWYFTRMVEKKEYPIFCRLPSTHSTHGFLEEFVKQHRADPKNATVPCAWDDEEVILDLNLLEKEHNLEFLEIADMDESPLGTKLCVAVDMSNGKEIFTLLVFDISQLKGLQAEKPKGAPMYKQLLRNPPIVRVLDMFDCSGDCAFISEHILAYATVDSQQRACRVVLHDLRMPLDDDNNDVILFEETDPRFTVGGLGTSDADCAVRYFSFSSNSKDVGELHRARLPDADALSSLTIPDFVALCECFVPRPASGIRCEINELWHENLDGQKSEGWFLVHNVHPYEDFTVSYILEQSCGAGVLSSMRNLLECPPSVIIESLEAQRDFLLLSVRELGFQNAYVFPMNRVQSVIRGQMSGHSAVLRLCDGINLSAWAAVHSPSVQDGEGCSMWSIEASVSETNTFGSDIIRVSIGNFMRRSEVWDVSARHLFGLSSPFTPIHLHTEHLPGGGFSPEHYESVRLLAPAVQHVPGTPGADGDLTIPIILCYRKDVFARGANPLVLDVYGSYGDCFDAEFNRNRLSLLDRGVVCAIAWVRGGGEMGRQWRDAGRLQFRENSITDLCACAEYLLKESWCEKKSLVIRGGSAGGTLVCGAMTRRPELFQGVLASVPFVDCLTTMLDPRIPLTTLEWEEWGNPVVDRDAYTSIKSYSPMDSVPGFDLLAQPARKPTTKSSFFPPEVDSSCEWPAARQKVFDMPHIYVESGMGDSRVAYWEPAAFVARLRAVTHAMEEKDASFKAPLILHRCQMGAGHGGASGRFAYLRDIAREYAFIFKILGTQLQERDCGRKYSDSDESEETDTDV